MEIKSVSLKRDKNLITRKIKLENGKDFIFQYQKSFHVNRKPKVYFQEMIDGKEQLYELPDKLCVQINRKQLGATQKFKPVLSETQKDMVTRIMEFDDNKALVFEYHKPSCKDVEPKIYLQSDKNESMIEFPAGENIHFCFQKDSEIIFKEEEKAIENDGKKGPTMAEALVERIIQKPEISKRKLSKEESECIKGAMAQCAEEVTLIRQSHSENRPLEEKIYILTKDQKRDLDLFLFCFDEKVKKQGGIVLRRC